MKKLLKNILPIIVVPVLVITLFSADIKQKSFTDFETFSDNKRIIEEIEYNDKTYKIEKRKWGGWGNLYYAIILNKDDFYYIPDDVKDYKTKMFFLTIDKNDYLFIDSFGSKVTSNYFINLTTGKADDKIKNLPKVFSLTEGDWITYIKDQKILFSKIDHSISYEIANDIDSINELPNDQIELKFQNTIVKNVTINKPTTPKTSDTQPIPKAQETQPIPKTSDTPATPKTSETQPIPKISETKVIPKVQEKPKTSDTQPIPKAQETSKTDTNNQLLTIGLPVSLGIIALITALVFIIKKRQK